MKNAIHTRLELIASNNAMAAAADLPAIDIMGPKIQFLEVAEEFGSPHRLMLVSVPPGVSVPLHSHVDPEFFLMLEGELEMLNQTTDTAWKLAGKGSFIEIKRDDRHAFRNVNAETAKFLCATTDQMASFFSIVGETTIMNGMPAIPTQERIANFIAAAARFAYWIGSPEENHAAGM